MDIKESSEKKKQSITNVRVFFLFSFCGGYNNQGMEGSNCFLIARKFKKKNGYVSYKPTE